MKIAEYLKSLIKANTLNSSKSFALVLSSLIGAFVGLFMLCIGGFMAGGGINKAISERGRTHVKPINKGVKDEIDV